MLGYSSITTRAKTQTAGDNSTLIATDAFVTTAVANAVAGINPAIAVQAATTQVSDTSGFTYNNGVSGVGATLTQNSAAIYTVDGYTFTTIGQRLLVKNDTQTTGGASAGAFNGIYNLTTVGTSLIPAVFTRASDYNSSADINNTGAIPVVSGTANALTSWLLTSSVTTVGINPLTYSQFSLNPTNVTGSGAIVLQTSPTLTTPALGTPSALVGTNITGTASGLTAGNVTTNANLTGNVTSVGNATTIASGVIVSSMLSTSSGAMGGAPATYTPSLGNITLGNGTLLGQATTIGKWTDNYFSITFGSTTAFTGTVTYTLGGGNGNYSLAYATVIGQGAIIKSSTAYQCYSSWTAGTSVEIDTWAVNSTYPTGAAVNATVPVALGTGNSGVTIAQTVRYNNT